MSSKKAKIALEPGIICDALAELQYRRKFNIKLRNKQVNATTGLVSRMLGYSAEMDEATGTKLWKRATRIVSAALAGKPQAAEDSEIVDAISADLVVVSMAVKPIELRRNEVELQMKRLVRQLPVMKWAKAVGGLGEIGVAVTIAETGDLLNYPNVAKVWKRLGLAPHDGRAYSTWRGVKNGLSAEDWTAAGYSPRRRAEVHSCVSDPLFRRQTVVAGPYRKIYDERRAHTAQTHPDWTKGHSHNDALRIMTKSLIADLWSAWRPAMGVVRPTRAVPAAEELRRAA